MVQFVVSYQSFGTRFLLIGHQFSHIYFLWKFSFPFGSAWSTIITWSFPSASSVRLIIKWYIFLTSFQSIFFSSNSEGKYTCEGWSRNRKRGTGRLALIKYCWSAKYTIRWTPTQFEPLPNCFKGTGLSGLSTITVTLFKSSLYGLSQCSSCKSFNLYPLC